MELEDKVRKEIVKREGDVERNKKRIAGLRRAVDADERVLKALREILGTSVEKEESIYKKVSLKDVIMDYARSHLNEEINSNNIAKHVARTCGQPPGKGTLSTYLGKLVKKGFLKRTGQKRFKYVIPKKVEAFPTTVNNKVDSKSVILEVLRSSPDEAMKTKQIEETIKQKYPTLRVSRDVIWFQLNRTLIPVGLAKKVSVGSYQYELPRKELREEDSFAVGGD